MGAGSPQGPRTKVKMSPRQDQRELLTFCISKAWVGQTQVTLGISSRRGLTGHWRRWDDWKSWPCKDHGSCCCRLGTQNCRDGGHGCQESQLKLWAAQAPVSGKTSCQLFVEARVPDVPPRAIEAPASLPPSRSPWSTSHCRDLLGHPGAEKGSFWASSFCRVGRGRVEGREEGWEGWEEGKAGDCPAHVVCFRHCAHIFPGVFIRGVVDQTHAGLEATTWVSFL